MRIRRGCVEPELEWRKFWELLLFLLALAGRTDELEILSIRLNRRDIVALTVLPHITFVTRNDVSAVVLVLSACQGGGNPKNVHSCPHALRIFRSRRPTPPLL